MTEANRKKRNKRLQALGDKLLEKLTRQLEQEEPDFGVIKQICATMKDLESLQHEGRQDGHVAVVLSPELEELSR